MTTFSSYTNLGVDKHYILANKIWRTLEDTLTSLLFEERYGDVGDHRKKEMGIGSYWNLAYVFDITCLWGWGWKRRAAGDALQSGSKQQSPWFACPHAAATAYRSTSKAWRLARTSTLEPRADADEMRHVCPVHVKLSDTSFTDILVLV
jgi:hypothetical protein